MSENKKRSIHDLIKEHSADRILDHESIIEINLTEIIANPNQPRKFFDEKSLEELSLSIKEHGVFQPIILTKKEGNFLIVSGERRYRASLLAGLTKIPAVVRSYSDSKIAEISLVENLQREDLSPIEEAVAYSEIISETNITQNELAKKVGKSRSYVTNIIGLLKLPEEIRTMLMNKEITMGHARAISKLENEELMLELANKVLTENLNVRHVEDITSGKDLKDNKNKINYNREYKVEREMLSKYYNSKIQIKNDRIIFKVEDENNIKQIIEQLIKNAL